MILKEEYERLSKEVENIGCHLQGCSYCTEEEKCKRIQFLEKWHKKEIR